MKTNEYLLVVEDKDIVMVKHDRYINFIVIATYLIYTNFVNPFIQLDIVFVQSIYLNRTHNISIS